MSALVEMTPGVLNALNRHPAHHVCDCGFPLPRYPGRYPKCCPQCGAERTPEPQTQDTATVSDSED